MLASFSLLKGVPRARFYLFFILALNLFAMSGCGLLKPSRKVEVSPLLTPLEQADTAALLAEINRMAAVNSLRGKIDIQFQDTSFAESGIAEKYRLADGSVTVQRPGQIYLVVQAPLVGTKIAEMTSDGVHFRVAVLQGDERIRRFARGTNDAVYPPLEMDGAGKRGGRGDGKNRKALSEQQTANVFSNLRPQHLTDALLIAPVKARPDLLYARSEFYAEEPDIRPRAKRGARIVRGYYFLDELTPSASGQARLLRRFWFDRVGRIRLARLQTFDQTGALLADASYGETKELKAEGGAPVLLPVRVEVTRPQDHYKLSVAYQVPEDVVVNGTYPPEIFVLANKTQLPEIDLDERAKQQQRTTGKP
jgi:hypothetical protein